jgi:hypothetical protein
MKKIIAIAMSLAALVTVAGGASAARARTDSGEYNTLVMSTDPAPAAEGHFSNGVIFKVRPGERFVTIEILDDHAATVMAVVEQDFDGDGLADSSTEICNATAEPIRVKSGYDVGVYTQQGVCSQGGEVSSPTFGTITATFTR